MGRKRKEKLMKDQRKDHCIVDINLLWYNSYVNRQQLLVLLGLWLAVWQTEKLK